MLTRRQVLLAACAPRLGLTVLADWRFGATRPDATVRNMQDLLQHFRTRYIYDHGKLDGLPTYWSRHREYPQGDPRSLHVFEADHLVLKGRIPPGGGLRPGGIESGMLRGLIPVKPGMVVEMRAKLPRGIGTWPAFWLNPGVEYPNGTFSALPWPPEIDIFEFFDWQGRPRPRVITCHVQTAGRPQDFGNPTDLYSKFTNGEYQPGPDFSAAYHVFALDWQRDQPVWLLDGVKIQQTRYVWNAPPAHILITNQIGMSLAGTDMAGMEANSGDWDYCIDYVRVFKKDVLF